MPAILQTDTLPGIFMNLTLLEQAQTFLGKLTATQFSEPCPAVYQASIGQHLRHALEHYEALMRAYSENGVVDYEHRRRELSLESDPQVAQCRISEIRGWLNQLAEEKSALLVLDHGGSEIPACSSLARELQFLASHTVHHFAPIGIIARLYHLPLAADFGIAPSTLRHRIINA